MPRPRPRWSAAGEMDKGLAPRGSAGLACAAACKEGDDFERPAPPVRIFGNTYMVGTCGISAILTTGKDGDILIDGGTEHGADAIASNIRSLGFRLSDVKILLHSHEHFDHVGGLARLQQLTGAQLYASAAAAPVLNSGAAGARDPQGGVSKPFPAAPVGPVVRGGEMGRLRGTLPIPRA